MPCSFLAYLFTRFKLAVYVDVRLFSLAFPFIDHGRKFFPILFLLIFVPIPFFKAYFILRFPAKR